MGEVLYAASLPLAPVTKKNSQRIILTAAGRRSIAPSRAYIRYEQAAMAYFSPRPRTAIDEPVEVTCVFYMPSRRRVDLTNLLEAIDDVLVKAGVLADDHSGIIVSHDGSRVLYDRDRPRTEITIRAMDGEEA